MNFITSNFKELDFAKLVAVNGGASGCGGSSVVTYYGSYYGPINRIDTTNKKITYVGCACSCTGYLSAKGYLITNNCPSNN